MESWKRKLRMGMVGGGQGAFIGECIVLPRLSISR